ncbi:MAG: hypothetical protein LBO70_03140 [Clostridiales Family XIII bacterium]|jgi:hypothetical protein|nr:hypothetical protein [Clostridiales Family XIII bacterium]
MRSAIYDAKITELGTVWESIQSLRTIFQMMENQRQAAAKNKIDGCVLSDCTGEAKIDKLRKTIQGIGAQLSSPHETGLP